MSLSDEIAEIILRKIKRVIGFLARVGMRKIINNQKEKPKELTFKKLNSKFANLERLDIQITKAQDLKDIRKIFNEHKINFSINKGIDKNQYSVFYPPKDVSKVENAMSSILDKQIKVNQKNKDKAKGAKNNDRKVPLKEQIERASKIVNERNKEIAMERQMSKSKVKGKGDLQL